MATITDFLNQANQIGVFSYILPFLLIFAVVFAILEKTGILSKEGKENRGVSAIIAAAIGLLSLQFDIVSLFFARIFPNVGVGIAVILVVLILVGLAGGSTSNRGTKTIGWIVAIVAVLWAIFNWNNWFGGYGYGGYGFFGGLFYSTYFWPIFWLAIVIAAIYWMTKSPGGGGQPRPGG